MIIPMKKLKLVALKEDKENLLISLQRYGEVMFIKHGDDTNIDTDASNEEIQLQRAEKSISLIRKYKAKHKGFADQIAIDYDEFKTEDPAQEKILATIENADEEINNLRQDNTALQEKLAFYLPWSGLDMMLSDLYMPHYAVIHTGTIETRNMQDFVDMISEYGGEIQKVGVFGYSQTIVYACYEDDDNEIIEKSKNLGFIEVILPSDKKYVSEIIIETEKAITKNRQRIETLELTLAEYAKQTDKIKLFADQAATAIKRRQANIQETVDTVYLEGWVRSDRIVRLKKAITDVTDVFDLELVDPQTDEIPPTVLKNNKFVDAFESVTDMFSKPNPYEIDPNPVMSIWYWIIFGMMMGDAGYGLLMVVVVGFLLKKMKPKGNMRRLFLIIFYGGFSTILWGILFGSYFGFTIFPILLEPINEPLKMLLVSLILGGCHLITGLVIKAYHNLRDKHYMAILSDSISWIVLLIGAGLLFLPATATVGKWMAIAGAAMIILFAGWKQKNPFARLGIGLYSLYGATSYLGDILSYSRILALAMSSAVLGMVMNMLAKMLATNVIGYFFAAIVFIIGHVFNLAMGLLSAYVHTSRLQYIEFYGKFYEGGGTSFQPLTLQLKHIDTVNDNINQ
ncbi:MAG: V-type ATP synthase subunit I [Candidatus Izemoplasmatales bacterium]|nr:V-type ATP synthase subunit I [Candidatus Izemoplasmatales bacterium]MDD3865118.1 V-type ATP synthase subunit I [Candidatus Izemoplasmatales bacterium]